MRDDRSLTGQLLPLALVGVLAVVAALGFLVVFDDLTVVVVALVGAVGAGAVSFLARRSQLLLGESIAASLVAFVVVGVVTVAGAPTPAAFSTFFSGLVGGWSDVLTSFSPVELVPASRALPLSIAWFGVLSGGEVLRRTSTPALPAVPPLIALATCSLFALEDRTITLAQGAAFAGVTLLLGLVQQRQRRDEDDELTTGSLDRWRRKGLVSAGAVLVAAVVAAPALGPRLPLADANERFDLREFIVPPWDPLAVPSPLVGVKGQLQDARAEEVVFRVASPEPVARWTVATLADFDGVVWTVAAPETGGEDFRPVDRRLPTGPELIEAGPTLHEHRIEVGSLGSHFLPQPGPSAAVEFEDGPRDVRLNARTGTLAVPEGLEPGDTYTVTGASTGPVTAAELAILPIAERTTPAPSGTPPAITSVLTAATDGAESAGQQLLGIRDLLVERGFYDEGPATPPGHSNYRLQQAFGDVERMVGYPEQYAAAAALLARTAGMEARVAVGYLVPPDRYEGGVAEVYAGDVSAWLEVRTDAGSWVPVDVTPDESRVPETEQRSQQVRDIAVPNPPPPPPDQPPPDREPTEQPVTESEDVDEDEEEVAGLPIIVLAGALPPLLLLALAAGIVAAKARRRRKRRSSGEPADQVSGAWRETLDRFREVGTSVPPSATRSEAARHLEVAVGAGAVHALAVDVDRATFHPTPPDATVAERAWEHYAAIERDVAAALSPWRRLRTRIDPRPLRSSTTRNER